MIVKIVTILRDNANLTCWVDINKDKEKKFNMQVVQSASIKCDKAKASTQTETEKKCWQEIVKWSGVPRIIFYFCVLFYFIGRYFILDPASLCNA